MRVKVLLALAIASVLLLGSAGIAFAADSSWGCGLTDALISGITGVPTAITGIPTAAQLTAYANNEINAFGFPDLAAVDRSLAVPADTIEAATLTSPICGVCGEIPPCGCTETTTIIPGPQVNLGCPLITTYPVPVNLVSPKITPTFPAINVAPQFCLGLPQVNTQLNCFDIECLPVTNINSCPVCVDDC